MRRFRSIDRLRDDRGAQAVEFALLSIPLLTIIYMLIGFGLALNQQIAATQLAREAARAAAICANSGSASVATCQTDATQRVADDKPAGFSGGLVAGTADISGCLSAPTTGVVSATVSVQPVLKIPFVRLIKGVSTTPCGG